MSTRQLRRAEQGKRLASPLFVLAFLLASPTAEAAKVQPVREEMQLALLLGTSPFSRRGGEVSLEAYDAALAQHVRSGTNGLVYYLDNVARVAPDERWEMLVARQRMWFLSFQTHLDHPWPEEGRPLSVDDALGVRLFTIGFWTPPNETVSRVYYLPANHGSDAQICVALTTPEGTLDRRLLQARQATVAAESAFATLKSAADQSAEEIGGGVATDNRTRQLMDRLRQSDAQMRRSADRHLVASTEPLGFEVPVDGAAHQQLRQAKQLLVNLPIIQSRTTRAVDFAAMIEHRPTTGRR